MLRWAKKSEQTYIRGLLGVKNQQGRARKAGSSAQNQHLATSLGTTPSALDNLIAKRKA
jgi:hypothetical protein